LKPSHIKTDNRIIKTPSAAAAAAECRTRMPTGRDSCRGGCDLSVARPSAHFVRAGVAELGPSRTPGKSPFLFWKKERCFTPKEKTFFGGYQASV